MRSGAFLLALAALGLAGCAKTPMLVMINPRNGVTVDCNIPDLQASSGDYLVSRACLSACQAHGFRPLPGVQVPASSADIPAQCMN